LPSFCIEAPFPVEVEIVGKRTAKQSADVSGQRIVGHVEGVRGC
jgi:hypothetical protein